MAAPDPRLAPTLGLAAAVAVGLWLAALLAVRRWGGRRLPRAGPTTMEPGPEPAAVVACLLHHGELGAAGAGVALLDLAARGHLAIDLLSGGTAMVRPLPPPAAPAPYDLELLRHVDRRREGASGVPSAAPVIDDPVRAAAWSRRFGELVAESARTAGLLQRRRFGTAEGLLVVAAAAVGVLVAAAVDVAASGGATAPDLAAVRGPGGGLGAVAGLALIGSLPQRDRLTAAGRDVVARWLGFAAWAATDADLRGSGPAAVTIWGRVLSGAAAVGACGAAIAVDVVPDTGARAMTRASGTWREVPVRWAWTGTRGRHVTGVVVQRRRRSVVIDIGSNAALAFAWAGAMPPRGAVVRITARPPGRARSIEVLQRPAPAPTGAPVEGDAGLAGWATARGVALVPPGGPVGEPDGWRSCQLQRSGARLATVWVGPADAVPPTLGPQPVPGVGRAAAWEPAGRSLRSVGHDRHVVVEVAPEVPVAQRIQLAVEVSRAVLRG